MLLNPLCKMDVSIRVMKYVVKLLNSVLFYSIRAMEYDVCRALRPAVDTAVIAHSPVSTTVD